MSSRASRRGRRGGTAALSSVLALVLAGCGTPVDEASDPSPEPSYQRIPSPTVTYTAAERAYLDAMVELDPWFGGAHSTRTLIRGHDICGEIYDGRPYEEQVEEARARHDGAFVDVGTEMAEEILAITIQHLCPASPPAS